MLKKNKPAKGSGAKGSGLGAGLEGGTTLIAHNTRLKGDVLFQEQLYVNGSIEGDVGAEGDDSATLVVCEGGLVKGEIRAPNVVIDGTVEGDVYATGKLELAAKAKVVGNVHYNLVEMQLGAAVNGQMVSLADAVADSAAPASGAAADGSQEDAGEVSVVDAKAAAGDVVTGIR